jgi:hypothetical protein
MFYSTGPVQNPPRQNFCSILTSFFQFLISITMFSVYPLESAAMAASECFQVAILKKLFFFFADVK